MRAINGQLIGVVDETAVRGQAMAALIHKYLTLPTYYPFRPVGDDQTIEYPCVFDHACRRFMLYAGNAFGATGFGLAVLEK